MAHVCIALYVAVRYFILSIRIAFGQYRTLLNFIQDEFHFNPLLNAEYVPNLCRLARRTPVSHGTGIPFDYCT